MKLESFDAFRGQHCETTTAGCLLGHLGLELSEPMLFGIGEGLGYIYWNSKAMDFPFIGGRVKPDVLTETLCRNLGLTLDVRQTTSLRKAWSNVAEPLARGVPVGLKLDSYHLDYFRTKVHFAGHYVALYGHDDHYAYLIDTEQQGVRVRTSLESLARARSETGPMSSRNLSFTIAGDALPEDLGAVVVEAIRSNAEAYLEPPITNLTYKGILKTSREVTKWFERSEDVQRDFQTTALLMERAGTGGALFRNIYRDFLQEAHELTRRAGLGEGAEHFGEIATRWTRLAECFDGAGETKERRFVDEASELLVELSTREKHAMEALLAATTA